jgi:hypothetical protein
MSDDPNVIWTQANPFGIQHNAAVNAWHAGRVTDVIALENGGILIATDSGGVWSYQADGTTFPVTDDQDNPNISCLAPGPFGPLHVYAGTRHDDIAADRLFRPSKVGSRAICPHCGAPNATTMMDELFAFICTHCGETVKVEPPKIH